MTIAAYKAFIAIAEPIDILNTVMVMQAHYNGADNIICSWAETSTGDYTAGDFGRIKENFLAWPRNLKRQRLHIVGNALLNLVKT